MTVTTYLLATVKNFFRYRFYTVLNILGLAISAAGCLILGVYVRGELTYDQHNLQHERIYRVVNLLNNGGFVEDYARIPQLVGPLMALDNPEISAVVRFQRYNESLIRHEDKAFYQDGIVFADPNVFDVFTHEIISGDPATALQDRFAIAISESFAEMYFGDEDPIGKLLKTDRSDFKVTLVFKDLPENVHLRYDALMSFNLLPPLEVGTPQGQASLSATTTYTYLLLPEDYDIEGFESISDSYWERYMAERNAQYNIKHRYYLEPLTDIHLNSTTMQTGDFPHGNKYFVYTLSAVGLFLLLVGCINYVNLATARSAKYARTIGMHKVLGANREQLALWFIIESIVFVCSALAVGILLADLVLTQTPIVALFGKSVSVTSLLAPGSVAGLLGIAIVIGSLSGIYPAMYLSSLQPLKALRPMVAQGPGSRALFVRHGLVLLQFVITIGVIAYTLVMYSQMQFFYSKSLGFDKENKVVLQLRSPSAGEWAPEMKVALLQNPGILGATFTNNLPGADAFSVQSLAVANDEGVRETKVLNFFYVDEDYLDVMGLEMLEGRNFDSSIEDGSEDVPAAIMNDTAVRNMGWEDAIGKDLGVARVVGVVRDFNFQNLREELDSLVLVNSNRTRYLILNVSGDSIAETIRYIKDVWTQFESVHPFEFFFLDESLQQMYGSERHQMTLLGLFAGLCIFVACLGLFGLATFMTEQRTREIGVRRVFGASKIQIVMLLFTDVSIVLACAAPIASILSYLAANRWLEGFAYHVAINPLVFAVATAISILIAFGTVAAQTIRVLQSAPVEALRYE